MTGTPTVVVTGAGGAIGRAVAIELAGFGCRVVGADLSADSFHDLATELGPEQFTGIAGDLTVPDVRTALVDAAVALGPVHGLVNCAGALRDRRLANLDADFVRRLLEINLASPLDLVHRLAPHLVRGGAVVNVASRAWLGTFGSTVYSGAKGGLVGATRALALELGPRGVTVNAVAPGFIESQMTAQLPDAIRERSISAIAVGRAGRPDDVAPTVRHLLLDAPYLTGQVIPICGGRSVGGSLAPAAAGGADAPSTLDPRRISS